MKALYLLLCLLLGSKWSNSLHTHSRFYFTKGGIFNKDPFFHFSLLTYTCLFFCFKFVLKSGCFHLVSFHRQPQMFLQLPTCIWSLFFSASLLFFPLFRSSSFLFWNFQETPITNFLSSSLGCHCRLIKELFNQINVSQYFQRLCNICHFSWKLSQITQHP